MPPSSSMCRQIYAVVARIPRGQVATYGQVARLAGLPRRARFVGYALSVLTDRTIPWHRVINARGEISRRQGNDEGEEVQRLRLEAERVVFDSRGTIDLLRYQWIPSKPLQEDESEK